MGNITQSCDLVRRGEGCKSKYITLAAVRPIEIVISRLIENFQSSLVEKRGNICDQNMRSKLYEFLSKLLNNNLPEYFYLHNDPQNNLSQNLVAFLQLSISIKADWHYEKCLEAKVLELKNSFKAKLGWLIGNIYSRVGTEDWTPDNYQHHEFKKILTELVDRNVAWVERDRLKKLKKTITDGEADKYNEFEIRELARGIEVKDKKDVFFDQLNSLLEKKEGLFCSPENAEKFYRVIKSDEIISNLLK